MDTYSKILLTGGSGMVGKNFIEHCTKKGLSIMHPSRDMLDLLNYHQVCQFFQKYRPEIVIHLAGIAGGIQANINEPQRFLIENLDIGRNVVLACYESGIKKMLNISSCAVYPINIQNPLVEENIFIGKLEPTNENYALAKLVTMKLCETISQSKDDFQYKTIFPCNLYGKHDTFSQHKSHMVPAVIRKIHEVHMKKLNSVTIWGNGKARREFMYGSDFADFLLYALQNFDKLPMRLNVGTGKDYTIDEYYQIIAQVIGYKGTFNYDNTKPQGVQQKLLDITKLKKLGWHASTSLMEGIQKTYQFYLQTL